MFMRSTIKIGLAMGAVLMAAAPVLAHHAFAAEFDGKTPVKLQGTVTKMEWINPHAWIHIDVKDKDGKVTNWMVECGTPNTLLRRGVNKNSVTAGMEIVVDGYQAKDGSNKANGRDVTFADGRKVFLGSTGTGAPGDASEK
jgi:Family of unknown function (DUF6152)